MSEPTKTLAMGVQTLIGERFHNCQRRYAQLIEKHAAATDAEIREMADALHEMATLKSIDASWLGVDASALRREKQLREIVQTAEAEVARRWEDVQQVERQLETARSTPASTGTVAAERLRHGAANAVERARLVWGQAVGELNTQKLALQKHLSSDPYVRISTWKTL